MGILEVHDATGRVERVALQRDHAILIGSSPKCEVVLPGDRVFPIHARILWNPRKDRFKVRASPDAEYVVVNGHKMTSSSLRPGDEIEVAGHRLFLINDHDAVYRESPTRDDRTVIQPPPFAAEAGPVGNSPGRSRRRPPAEPKPRSEGKPARLGALCDHRADGGLSAL